MSGRVRVMFRRIAEAKRILTYRRMETGAEPTCEIRPAQEPHTSNVSRRVASLMEVFAFAFLVGGIARFSESIMPHKTTADILPWVAILTGALVVLLNQSIHRVVTTIQQRLRIGEHIAPFFGHRIERVYRVLKG